LDEDGILQQILFVTFLLHSGMPEEDYLKMLHDKICCKLPSLSKI